MTKNQGKARYRPHPHVMSRRLGDELVLMNLESGQMFTLSATGARFWELLEKTGSLAAVRAQVTTEFAVEPDRLTHELQDLIATLEAKGLVVMVE